MYFRSEYTTHSACRGKNWCRLLNHDASMLSLAIVVLSYFVITNNLNLASCPSIRSLQQLTPSCIELGLRQLDRTYCGTELSAFHPVTDRRLLSVMPSKRPSRLYATCCRSRWSKDVPTCLHTGYSVVIDLLTCRCRLEYCWRNPDPIHHHRRKVKLHANEQLVNRLSVARETCSSTFTCSFPPFSFNYNRHTQ